MSSKDSTTEDTEAAANEEASAGKELPRFIQAIQRYEQFLTAKADEQSGSPEQRAEYFSELTLTCKELVGTAQLFELARSIPDLAGTQAEVSAGQTMVRELSRDDIPAEVKSIYRDLYGAELAAFEEEKDT